VEIILMRSLKLIIWDLDETILTGILEEGDENLNPVALKAMSQLGERGILQALATQNSPELILLALEKFGWSETFVQVKADWGSKARKIKHILHTLAINPLDAAFVDEDPFERVSISTQLSQLTAWSIADLQKYLDDTDGLIVTEEAHRRPQMYREQQVRIWNEENADHYSDFLRSCNIQLTIRPYSSADAPRAEELLTRAHRMNLGVLPVAEAIARLNRPDDHHVIMAEMKDIYGEMGRCGLIHLTPLPTGEAMIESLVISCRIRARGLSLALLVGLLRYPENNFQKYRCRYIFNGSNRPLRMLLLGVGFKPQFGTDELVLHVDQLMNMELPDWVGLNYRPALEAAW
jgi:methoxymalonate biosynthesis protein